MASFYIKCYRYTDEKKWKKGEKIGMVGARRGIEDNTHFIPVRW